MPVDLTNRSALLDRRQKILEALSYNEMRIEEVRAECNASSYYEEDSSDSDTELGLPDIGPSVVELKLHQNKLKTCSQATQELTSLTVLQSEVFVIVEPPGFHDEPPVQEGGVWRELTAECRIDYVPFSITFHAHKPDGEFSSCAYRGLRVVPVKAAQEAELARSVLHRLARPADAVQVLRSYAASYRSRRASLARLAERYGSALHMEPHPEGGFVLKCANVLEVSWRLENKWSPVAPFHHRLKFDLEYLDEAYIKIISQTHKQLSDPSLNTDERTLLLSKIISTCQEAQGPSQDLYESLESDQESIKRNKTILDQEIDDPKHRKTGKRPTTIQEELEEGPPAKKDTEVMAPPKTLPKRNKPKGKENNVGYKAVKRASTFNDGETVKKARVGERRVDDVIEKKLSNEHTQAKVHGVDKNGDNNKDLVKRSAKDPKVEKKATEQSRAKTDAASIPKQKHTNNAHARTDNAVKANAKVNSAKDKTSKLKTVRKNELNPNNDVSLKVPATNSKTVHEEKEKNSKDKTSKVKSKENAKSNTITTDKGSKVITDHSNDKRKTDKENAPNKVKINDDGSKKANSNDKRKTDKENAPNKVKINDNGSKKDNSNDKLKTDKENAPNKVKINNDDPTKSTLNMELSKKSNTDTIKSKEKLIKKTSNGPTTETKPTTKDINSKNPKSTENIKPADPKATAKAGVAIKKNAPVKDTADTTMRKVIEKNVAVKTKARIRDVTTEASLRNSLGVLSKVTHKSQVTMLNKYTVASNKFGVIENGLVPSKIPQKARVSQVGVKRNPLRISPRKISSIHSSKMNVKITKPNTNIPRLMKKPLRKS